MELPTSLAERAVVVCWDVDRRRMRGRDKYSLVNAAVLLDLWLSGWVGGEKKAVASNRARPWTPPPEHLDMLVRIRDARRPKQWRVWVRLEARDTWSSLIARMAANGTVRVEDRWLGRRVSVPNPYPTQELVARCRRAVLGPGPVSAVPPEDAALVSLVVAAELATVFSGWERRRHRRRIAELTRRCGPVPVALKKVGQEVVVYAVPAST